jgi:hypothetical protein
MQMKGIDRALATLIAAGATGCLMWVAAHFDRATTGGYWAALGLLAAGGLLVGLAQLHTDGNPRAMFLLAFLPVFIAGGWILVAAEPAAHMNWFSRHVGAWSSDIGIGNVIASPAEFLGALAFGIGLTCGLSVHPGLRRRTVVAPAEAETIDPVAADEPTMREREAEPVSDGVVRTPTRTVSR